MNDEILKLCEQTNLDLHWTQNDNLAKFYRAAFNAGIEAARAVCESTNFAGVPTYGTNGFECARSIRKLEMK